MASTKKPPVVDRSNDWGPWTAAHFQSQAARDRFVCAVSITEESGRGAQAVLGDVRAAEVRWRPGQFLGLNDLAYAHGGRILVHVGHHRIR